MAGFTLDSTYGAYTIGTFVSNILLGVTCIQTYIYFRSYKDGLLSKATVILLLILELLHGAVSMHVVYHTLVTDYFNPLLLEKTIWSLHVSYGFTGSILLVVHIAYATRIYRINGHKPLIPIFIVFVSLATFSELHNIQYLTIQSAGASYLAFSACTWSTVGIALRSPIEKAIPLGSKLGDAVLITTAVLDILTAGTLSYLLNKSHTGIKQTDKLISSLLVYIINNGILTSLVDVAAVILIFVGSGGHDDLVAPSFSLVIGSLYTNSWLATLNSRRRSTLNSVGDNSHITVTQPLSFPSQVTRNETMTAAADTGTSFLSSNGEPYGIHPECLDATYDLEGLPNNNENKISEGTKSESSIG